MAKWQTIGIKVQKIFDENVDITTWTVRQIYYKLVTKKIIPNKLTSYTQFDSQLVKLRRLGIIDDAKIIDPARYVIDPSDQFIDIEDYWNRFQEELGYKEDDFFLNRWENQKYNVVMVLEKDALSRIISPITLEWHVPLFVGRGYSSRTQVLNMADRCDLDKEDILLYLGDFDPSGLDIERSLDDRLLDETSKGEFDEFTVKRVELTYDTAKNLPSNPTKKASGRGKKKRDDPRREKYIQKYGDVCWELDALTPQYLKKTVEDEIKKYVDMIKWQRVIDQEDESKSELKERFTKAMDSIKKGSKRDE